MIVLEGHALIGNGTPHNVDGFAVPTQWSSMPGGGHAKCGCGEVSNEDLPSVHARRRWHRAHKMQVLARQGTPRALEETDIDLVDRAAQ